MKKFKQLAYAETILLYGDLKNAVRFCIWMLKRINFVKVIAIIAVILIEAILLYGIYISRHTLPILNILVGAVVFLVVGSLSITLLKEVKP